MGSLREINSIKNDEKYDQEVKEFVDSLDKVIENATVREVCGLSTPRFLKSLEFEFEFNRVLRYLNKRPYRVRCGCYDAIMLRELSLQRLGFIVEDNILGFSEKRQAGKPLWVEPIKHRGVGYNWKEKE